LESLLEFEDSNRAKHFGQSATGFASTPGNLNVVTSQGESSAEPSLVANGFPTELVVVGAAAGIGRWIGEHILRQGPGTGSTWDRVTLLDTAESVLHDPHTAEEDSTGSGYQASVFRAQIRRTDNGVSVRLHAASVAGGAPLETAMAVKSQAENFGVWRPIEDSGLLGRPNTCVLLAVPVATLGSVAAWLLPLLHPTAIVVDTSMDRATAARTLGSAAPGLINVWDHG
jgi:hypothetical protein